MTRLAQIGASVATTGALALGAIGLRRARNARSRPAAGPSPGGPAAPAPAAPPAPAPAPASADSREYRLLDGADLGPEVRRIARGRIDHARDQLTGAAGHGAAESVHEARKDIKKLRSLLRLVRDDLGEEVYRRENDWLRQTARGLAGARDAEVLAVTLDGLVPRDVDPAAVAPLRAGLQEVRRRAAGDPRPAMTVAVQRLDVLRARVDSWPLSGDARALQSGLRRSYERGRRWSRRAAREPRVHGLHEWRKRVKDLWYQATILRLADPALEQAADRAHELSTLLGDDHDLGLLGQAAEAGGFLFADPEDQHALGAAVGRRREALQPEAFALAERLYRPAPKAFAAGVARWSRAAGSVTGAG